MRKRIMIVAVMMMAMGAIVAGCAYDRGSECDEPSARWMDLLKLPCVAAPIDAKLLDELGELALVAGETMDDTEYNKGNDSRNTLYLRRRRADGIEEWRILLTTGVGWREASGMDTWHACQANSLKRCFFVVEASFSSNGRHLWLVCDTHTCLYKVVCSYDVWDKEFRVLIDGYTAKEQSDGTIFVADKKTYLTDENGEPLGARWYDLWMTPEGKIVRKGKLRSADE